MSQTSHRTRGKLLRKFRKQYRITLTEFGKLAGLSQPMLSQFERGDHNLSDEAWTRVLAAMSNLITEDNAKRLAEIARAKETAAKLGALDPFSIANLFSVAGADQIAKEQAEIEAERIRLEKERKLSLLIGASVDATLAELEAEAVKPENVPELLQTVKNLYMTIHEHNRRMAELSAQGYVMMPKAVEDERDQLKARVAELEEELTHERSKVANG